MSKTLIWDIETAPLLGTAWKNWETDLVWIVKDWYMIGFAWKWLDEKKVHVRTLPDYKTYKKNPEDDTELIKELLGLLSQADITIAHNGDRFDVRKANTRIILNGLDRPLPYKTIDTLKVAKRYFAFTSNKLDDLGEALGVGRKIKTDKDLWKGCMRGDEKAWAAMARYNKRDVSLLERVYLRLRPWIDNHPALNVLDSRPTSCRKCGDTRMHKVMKYRATNTNLYQYYRCQKCGGMATSRVPEYKQAKERMEYV